MRARVCRDVPVDSRGLDAECSTLVAVVRAVTLGDFSRPTNCPPWTLHELVVHIADSIETPAATIALAPPPAHRRTAADYYRRPERATIAYRTSNVERVCRRAADVRTDDDANLLTATWQQTSATMARQDPDNPLRTAGLTLRVEDYLLTRLMSVAAHGLDVAITLRRPPFTTQLALQTLRPVLLDLLGGQAPNRWTDQDLLALGTGRRPPPTTLSSGRCHHGSRCSHRPGHRGLCSERNRSNSPRNCSGCSSGARCLVPAMTTWLACGR